MSKSEITRRELLIATSGLGFARLIAPRQRCYSEHDIPVQSTKVAIARLKLGNGRFVEGKPKHFRETHAWRESLVSGQNPFAVILFL